ncbi:hypothetical protein CLU79DRAFT_715207 [Phycomyces nitens]|nr:hypothetical protein CLU79DRAFT_715207 [Phycomyces nitens]
MADTYTSRSLVIRLPKSKSGSTRSNDQDMHYRPEMTSEPFTDTLYFEGLITSTSESDFRVLLEHYQPTDVVFARDRCSGFLRFSDPQSADRVYSVCNGFTFSDGSKLQLYINRDKYQDPEPQGDLLEVKGLPSNIDDDGLYEIFRPYGPLSVCKPIVENNTFRGTALIQYFLGDDSDNAQHRLHGKSLYAGGNMITITPFTTIKANSKPISSFDYKPNTTERSESSHVDYMNLYIKNLDPSITSDNLKELFGKYGHIVSARVMSNPSTRQSKGYGFVSYGKPEEAHDALKGMNNYVVGSKALIVAYHEPKRPRQEKSMNGGTSPNHNIMSYSTNTHQSIQAQEYPSYTPSHIPEPYYADNRHPHDMMMQPPIHMSPVSGLGIDNVDQLASNIKDLSIGQRHQPMAMPVPHPTQRKPSLADLPYGHSPHSAIRLSPQFPSPPISGTSTGGGHSLASLASGISIQQAPPMPHPQQQDFKKQQPEGKPSLRRRGSLESMCSVMTETSSNVQHQKMTNAVMQCGSFGKSLPDIVEMLLTLKRKERTLCLFNQDFLQEKIDLALEALDVFSEEFDTDEEEGQQMPLRKHPGSPLAADTSSAMFTGRSMKNINTVHSEEPALIQLSPPRHHIPVEIPQPPPPAAAVQAPPPQQQQPSEENGEEATLKLLESLEGRPSQEKKQLLGDRLFPLVKATGAKHAPKITIRLLDTIKITELAHLMYDKEALKKCVDVAAASLK